VHSTAWLLGFAAAGFQKLVLRALIWLKTGDIDADQRSAGEEVLL
jgi:hypothetical protein